MSIDMDKVAWERQQIAERIKEIGDNLVKRYGPEVEDAVRYRDHQRVAELQRQFFSDYRQATATLLAAMMTLPPVPQIIPAEHLK